ncbi:hypothetical protein FRC01_008721 [Tulasnella sp. 417]|nr:hypothetical protein FRC01_008721 [Tulasnella sp. 417]
MSMPQERSVTSIDAPLTSTSCSLPSYPPVPEITPCQKTSGGRIVVLNGFPGAGKFTILKHAKELLPAKKTCLLDNHLLIDPVQAIYPDRSPEHHELRRKLREPVFQSLSKLAQEGHVVLMTACLADDNDRDAAVFQEHLAMVRGTEVPFFWVNVHCEQAVLEQRIRNQERCQSEKTKLTDVGVLQKLVREHRLIQPSESGGGSARLVVEVLDVSGAVEMSVSRLMDIVGLTQSVEPVKLTPE